jgi:hypothetical protein
VKIAYHSWCESPAVCRQHEPSDERWIRGHVVQSLPPRASVCTQLGIYLGVIGQFLRRTVNINAFRILTYK